MKTDALLLLFVSCLTLQVDADENLIRPQQLHVFPKQSELVYGWRADVSTGARVTDSHDNHASHFAITANLRVRSDATSSRVEFKLEDILYSSYNGKVTNEKLPEIESSFLRKCETFGKPFIANYDATQPGQIANVELSTEDEVYARNMKRAIMAQFQLDFQNIPSKRAFHNMEFGVNSWCPVEQYLQDVSGNGTIFTLRKFYDSVRCSKRTAFADTLAFKIFRDQTNELISTTMRNYVIAGKSPDTLMIKEVESRSEINVQPHGIESEVHFHFTNQKLDIISESEASTDSWDIGKTLKSSLEFELVKENETHPDLTFGAMKHDPKNAVNKTVKIMQKLAARFHSKSTDKEQTEELHALTIMRQLNSHTLKRMSSESLEQLVQRILLTKDETLRAVLLELLPRIGTLAATRTIVALYNNNSTDLTSREKKGLLMAMPFYLRHHTEQLVKECESLLTSSNTDTEILAFSSIVGEVCEKPRACSSKLVEGYVKKFIAKIEASEEYGEQLLYLQALNNIQVYPVGKYMETMLRDRVNYGHKLRYAAAWSAHHIQIHDSHKTYEIFWPILEDSEEHPEMRQSALAILLLSRPSPTRFLKIFWFVSSARNRGLHAVFYTTVQSLLDTQDPSLRYESKLAKLVTRSMPNPKRSIHSYAPTNLIRDFFDPDTGMGYTYQELSVENIVGHPTVKSFDLKKYMHGVVSKDLSLYTRGINIDTSLLLGRFNTLSGWRNHANDNFVPEVLRPFRVTSRTEFKDSVEIIVRVRDRTVLCLSHIEKMESKEIVELLGLQDFMTKFNSLRDGSSDLVTFNNMIFDMTTAIEIVKINDIGLPVTSFTHHPDMLAFVGNISVNSEGEKILINSNLAIRFIGQRARGMYTLNPIIGQWQGVVRSKIGDMFLPLGHDIEFDISNRTLNGVALKWEKDQVLFNAMSHVHTTTYSFGDDQSLSELKKSCPQCSNIHAVSSGSPQEINQLKHELLDSEFELTSDLYDCEISRESQNHEIIWNALTSSQNKNDRNTPWSIRLFMLWLQMNDLNERFPYSGSCGQSIRIAQKGEARQLILMIPMDNRRGFFGEAIFKRENGETIKTWTLETDTNYNRSVFVEMSSSIHIARKLQENPNFNMVCLQLDAGTPKLINENDIWDVLYEPLPQPYRVSLTVTIGDTEDGFCPAKSGGKLRLTAYSTPSLKPQYTEDGKLCQRNENQVFPATLECAKAIRNTMNARNISINIKHNNLSANLQATAAAISTKLQSFLPYIIPGCSYSPVSEDSNYDENSVMWVNGIKMQRPTKNWDIPNMFKLREVFSHREKKSCVAAGGYVLTYDEASVKFTAGDQWTLLSAQCISLPRFAVFVRRVQGSDTLNTRIQVASDMFDVSRRDNKTFVMSVNGDPFDPVHPRCKYMAKVELNDDMVRIYETSFGVKITNRSVTVTTSSGDFNSMCGLCGDYNYQSESEYGFPGPDGKLVAPEDLVRVYSTDVDINLPSIGSFCPYGPMFDTTLNH